MPDEYTKGDLETARLIGDLSRSVADLRNAADELKAVQADTNKAVEELKRDVLHYKGFVGGIAFVLSGMWIALVAFKGYFFGDGK